MHFSVPLLCLGGCFLLNLPILCLSACSPSLGQPPTASRTPRIRSARSVFPQLPLGKSPLSHPTSLSFSPSRSVQRKYAAHPPASSSSVSSSLSQSDSSHNWTLACITWNLQEMTPSMDNCRFLRSFRSKDLVVVGVQECEHLRPRRHEGRRSRALREQLDTTLGWWTDGLCVL